MITSRLYHNRLWFLEEHCKKAKRSVAARMPALKIVKRTGEVVDFDRSRIRNALVKAVTAVGQKVPDEILDETVTDICTEIDFRFVDFYPNVENVQDIVEKHLVKKGLYEIAKEYILYRNKRQQVRDEKKKEEIEKAKVGKLTVTKRDGKIAIFDMKKIRETIARVSKNYEKDISVEIILKETIKNVYDKVPTVQVENALILATVAYIEKDPAYSSVASRLFIQKLRKEVFGASVSDDDIEFHYKRAFVEGIKKAVKNKLLDKRMLDFDLEKLSSYLLIDRDDLFGYMGIQTLYERYFIKLDDMRLELPQAFWMRVAMGLAISETDKEKKAAEFYKVMSALRYVPSTPTLFHSGTMKPQLSSCYLTTVNDDLGHIFKCISDNAQLSKWSGGLGNDWTNIRATGSLIKSTNVESQGVVPFLKIANDVTAAINRSGKRRGATCAYMETWHLDIEDFLDLRRNTGDERRRTHDMNTANWIPDLFMKRVISNGDWTLFSPDEVPELHHIYGKEFEKKYNEYEEKAKHGMIRKFKTMPALQLWKKMLTRLFETGHPWVTFKDPCNIRSPQDHAGVIHSSNLCTEITLNTSTDETAVCNLGSINLAKHITDGALNKELLADTVLVAMRMLDNVIDVNYYPTIEARNSNFKHRPVGLGIMGVQDALYLMDLPFESDKAVDFSDELMELISYHAILGSSELAKERGTYESYKGSKWDRGIFPQDTIELLGNERGMRVDVNLKERLDWKKVRDHVKKHGMRNSNTMAIAPTATISNISGCFPCIEPIYKNIYVKSNISGEFTVVNTYLVNDLKKLDLWGEAMLEQLKYYDGTLQLIVSLPESIKKKYKETFEIDPEWHVKHAAERGKWIDQSQSLNIFMKGASGKKLNDVYIEAWKRGLKTTYYLRTLAASQIEKSTLDASKYGFTQKREYAQLESEPAGIGQAQKQELKVCSIDNPECEACE